MEDAVANLRRIDVDEALYKAKFMAHDECVTADDRQWAACLGPPCRRQATHSYFSKPNLRSAASTSASSVSAATTQPAGSLAQPLPLNTATGPL